MSLKNRALTLIELLVVIAIIAIWAAILFPVLPKPKWLRRILSVFMVNQSFEKSAEVLFDAAHLSLNKLINAEIVTGSNPDAANGVWRPCPILHARRVYRHSPMQYPA